MAVPSPRKPLSASPGRGWVVAALLALAHVSQAAYPAANTTCVESSANSTSWQIRNFALDTDSKLWYGQGTIGKVSFSIKNSANGYEFSCSQGNGQEKPTPNFQVKEGKVWYSCNTYCNQGDVNPALDTSFHFDMDNKTLSVSQKWACAGTNASAATTYQGTGSAVVSNLSCTPVPNGRPDEMVCKPIDITVPASTVRPVTGTPAYQAVEENPPYTTRPRDPRPSGFISSPPAIQHNTPGCSARSQAGVAWDISRVLFNYAQSPRFVLTNTALDYTVQCALNDLTTDYGRFEAPVWRNCSRYSTNRATYPYDGIYTEVLYGGGGDVLGINQTWYCDDEASAGGQATVFSASATTLVRFACNQTRLCSPSVSPEQGPVIEYRESCATPAMTLAANGTRRASLPAEAARTLFTPHGYNCSERSLAGTAPQHSRYAKPAWEVGDVVFSRAWNAAWEVPGFMDEMRFRYNNTATNREWPMIAGDRSCYDVSSQWKPLFDGTGLLHCLAGQRDNTYFRFDFNSSMLTLVQVWGCDGMDIDHSNYFNAVGSVKLPLECKQVGNGTSCAYPGTINVPMSNFTTTMNSELPIWEMPAVV